MVIKFGTNVFRYYLNMYLEALFKVFSHLRTESWGQVQASYIRHNNKKYKRTEYALAVIGNSDS